MPGARCARWVEAVPRGWEALAQVAQRGSECPISEGFQGQAGCNPELLDCVVGKPAHDEEVKTG